MKNRHQIHPKLETAKWLTAFSQKFGSIRPFTLQHLSFAEYPKPYSPSSRMRDFQFAINFDPDKPDALEPISNPMMLMQRAIMRFEQGATGLAGLVACPTGTLLKHITASFQRICAAVALQTSIICEFEIGSIQ